MSVSSPPILKILSDLDIDLMDVNNDVDYLRALMEATNALVITNASDKRIPVLQEEIARVRADRKAADPKFKQRVKKTTVSPKKIMGQKMLPPAKLDAKKLAPKGGGGDALSQILVSVTSIRDILINQIKDKRDDAKKKRRATQNANRKEKESGLEILKKGFKGVKSGVEKVVAPVKNLFKEVLDFIGKIVFGRIIFKLMEWFSDKKNQDKVKAIGKFLKKTWPVLLAAFLLFGNAFGRMAVKLGVMITKFSIRLVTKIIPALVKAIAKMKMGKLLKKIPGFNKGGEVPGSGNTDTVPAMLTPGEFVMSKGAVEQYGVDTLEGMNAAAGGTNIPTLGVVTDPEEKKRIEEETLFWVNKERTEFLGLPPLDKISYADGVELTKAMGPEYYGKGIKETSDTRMDFDNMTKTTWRTKSRGAEIIFEGASEMLTEEDKQAYLDSNPQARMALELKDQLELDALGADISSNARMGYAGGGLVNGNSGGGLHLLGSAKGYGKAEAGSRKFSGDQLKGLLDSQKGIGATVKKPTVTPTQINRSINKPNVTSIRTPVKKSVVQAYEETKANIKLAPVGGSNDMTPPSAGGNDIPNFDPTFKRSKEKIKVLGISV
tara:strand:- start:1111 stop:2928 length:1818 start_codon:yes stop_codon:yes gene_type:complete